MADNKKDLGPMGDPLSEGEDHSENFGPVNSGNREESMVESGKDAFGRGSGVRNPDQTDQVNWDSGNPDDPDENVSGARRSAPADVEGEEDPGSSGTTGLGGESQRGSSTREPGGVEGSEGDT